MVITSRQTYLAPDRVVNGNYNLNLTRKFNPIKIYPHLLLPLNEPKYIFLQIAKAMLKKIDSYAQKIIDSKCKAT